MLTRRDLAYVLALGVVATPLLRPGAARAQALDEAAARAWLDAYGAAWTAKDAEAAAALFTPDATYHENTFEEPMRGQDEIRAYWEAVTAGQEDIVFSHELWSVADDVAIAHWTAEFTVPDGSRAKLDGVFHLAFAGPGTVAHLREWWFFGAA
jgi:uncharacterized protein (TIGR02246 family)